MVAADVELMELREEEAELTRRLGAVSLDDANGAIPATAPDASARAPAADANGSARQQNGSIAPVAMPNEEGQDDDSDDDEDDDDDDDGDDRCAPGSSCSAVPSALLVKLACTCTQTVWTRVSTRLCGHHKKQSL